MVAALCTIGRETRIKLIQKYWSEMQDGGPWSEGNADIVPFCMINRAPWCHKWTDNKL